MGFKPPSLCAGNESISVGLQAGVSGGIGATNACTWMYRLAFIAEHGLRSYKACRAALSWERMAAWPPKLVYFQAAEGHTIGLPFYSGHPALHPSGQLKLFKIDPVNFVLDTSFLAKKEVSRAPTRNLLRSNENSSVRNPTHTPNSPG